MVDFDKARGSIMEDGSPAVLTGQGLFSPSVGKSATDGGLILINMYHLTRKKLVDSKVVLLVLVISVVPFVCCLVE